MYNEKQKIAFIKDVAKSITVANFYSNLFEKTSGLETKWGKDIADASLEELQEFFDSRFGWKTRGDKTTLSRINVYIRWCSEHGFNNGRVASGSEIDSSNRVRNRLIPNPLKLSKELEIIFDNDDLHTSDIIYKCAFWLAFSGVKACDVNNVKKTDVDFGNLTIHYGGFDYDIYKESIKTMQLAISLDSFDYYHPLYTDVISRKRVDSESILAGVRGVPTEEMIRTRAWNARKKAAANAEEFTSFSIEDVWSSGIYYRMHMAEIAGIKPDFVSIIEQYDLISGKETMTRTINKIRNDYNKWKKAFAK